LRAKDKKSPCQDCSAVLILFYSFDSFGFLLGLVYQEALIE
jgi:hypothetical protein